MDEVDRDEVRVLFVSAADQIDDIRRAWSELEAAVGSLRGRKFFGTFDPVTEEYRACVRVDADLDELALEQWTIPGGRYARRRLRGEPPAVYNEIEPAVQALAAHFVADKTRPVIEFYRRVDEIDVLLPII